MAVALRNAFPLLLVPGPPTGRQGKGMRGMRPLSPPILLSPSWHWEQVTGTCVLAPPGPSPQGASPAATEVVWGTGGMQRGRGREALICYHGRWSCLPAECEAGHPKPGHPKPPSCLQEPAPWESHWHPPAEPSATEHAATVISHCHLLSSFSAEQSLGHGKAQ